MIIYNKSPPTTSLYAGTPSHLYEGSFKKEPYGDTYWVRELFLEYLGPHSGHPGKSTWENAMPFIV